MRIRDVQTKPELNGRSVLITALPGSMGRSGLNVSAGRVGVLLAGGSSNRREESSEHNALDDVEEVSLKQECLLLADGEEEASCLRSLAFAMALHPRLGAQSVSPFVSLHGPCSCEHLVIPNPSYRCKMNCLALKYKGIHMWLHAGCTRARPCATTANSFPRYCRHRLARALSEASPRRHFIHASDSGRRNKCGQT